MICENGSSVGICTRCFCKFGTDLYAQLVLINKISTSELRQKFIKSALLVGFNRKILQFSRVMVLAPDQIKTSLRSPLDTPESLEVVEK